MITIPRTHFWGEEGRARVEGEELRLQAFDKVVVLKTELKHFLIRLT